MIPQKSNNQIIAAQNYSPIRAKSFKVKTKSPDYAQYAATIRAYALAGMPFEHIANAGDHLGDIVERLELDAPIQKSWKQKVKEKLWHGKPEAKKFPFPTNYPMPELLRAWKWLPSLKK